MTDFQTFFLNINNGTMSMFDAYPYVICNIEGYVPCKILQCYVVYTSIAGEYAYA